MKDVLEELIKMQERISFWNIIIILTVSFLVALIIYFTYKNTFSGVMYNPRFNISLVMITMVTTLVMVVISSNISVSLGMVGALSIIRFRTAVKDPRDTSFIFWAVVAGLACGTQNFVIIVLGSIFLCIILFVFKKRVNNCEKYTLIIKGANINLKELDKYLNLKLKYCVNKAKYLNNNKLELIYDIKFNKDNLNILNEELTKLSCIESLDIIQSNTDIMG